MGAKKAHITVLKTEIVFIAAAVAAVAFTAGFLTGGARSPRPLEISAVVAKAAATDAGAVKTTDAPAKTKAPALSGKTNINTADTEELSELPGIGPAYAERIIEYRVSNGGFHAPEDIMNVSGIGEKTFLKLRELISVD